jgi:SAM-dependent methyltransferase
VKSHLEALPFAAYEKLADAYAARAENKAHNGWYERPATVSLLPDVQGLKVLDVGCGPGHYAAKLVERGATVLGLDASPRMLDHARQRVPLNAEFRLANIEATLPLVAEERFDVVLAPLVMDYIEDWTATFRRFHAALRPGGWFIFSAGHPAADAVYYQTENYAATEQVSALWTGFGVPVEVPSFRRSLSSFLNPLCEAGFVLDKVVEPHPTAEFFALEPEKAATLLRQPGFLCVRARRPPASV